MMESSKAEKRIILDDFDIEPLEPILVKIDKRGCAPHDIYVDKNEFKIGRARDNDEIILDVMISRRHCLLRCEGYKEWTIEDLSSSVTLVNDIPLPPKVSQRIYDGDIIQFSICDQFKYKFVLVSKEEHKLKKPKLDGQIFENISGQQTICVKSQECPKGNPRDKLLKQHLEQLLKQQNTTKEDIEDLRKIVILEGKPEDDNIPEYYLYVELLEKLKNERIQFEKQLTEEKQKWQEALNISREEKEALEIKMKEQMKKWKEEQQAEWKNVMENKIKEQKNIQVQLLNEKIILEEKLKETEKTLKEQEAKVETIRNNAARPSENSTNSCIFLEIINDNSEVPIIDTIDLTIASQLNVQNEEKESVLNKVSDVMDEQLTCSVCSELFVKATTLNCMHIFCQYCIKSWKKERKECPMCRAPIVSMNRLIILDNFIESMLENLPIKFKERRKEIIDERKVLEYKKKVR